jgi:CheY-like chemotaxis protein
MEPLNVLLIEDDADDERLALRALRACGAPLIVRVARDGQKALDALGIGSEGAAAEVPDLVISDLKVPLLGGDEILRIVRGTQPLENVPYVVFSSSDLDSDVSRCLEAGASEYFKKPMDYGEFVSCVKGIATRYLAA